MAAHSHPPGLTLTRTSTRASTKSGVSTIRSRVSNWQLPPLPPFSFSLNNNSTASGFGFGLFSSDKANEGDPDIDYDSDSEPPTPPPEMHEEEIVRLARTLTSPSVISVASMKGKSKEKKGPSPLVTIHPVSSPALDSAFPPDIATPIPVGVNPFSHSEVDPSIDPHSEQFDYHKWIRSLLAIQSRDPHKHPTRTAGISFSNLNVHGYGRSTDYQRTVGNAVFGLAEMVRNAMRSGEEGGSGQRVDILRDFKGVVRDGEMLLVLGPPGSGCSTFLKTLSGETHGFHVDKYAKINYQGIPWETMHRDFRGEVVYNAESDTHFPNLTVGQTLSFAARARTPSSRVRLPGVSRSQYAEHMKDVVLRVFGLTHTENTKVGNDFIRGVSGGERKRVSIAEVVLSGAPVQCWDNCTRGLDAATALEFVKTVRTGTRYTGASAVVAVYQASQGIYDAFDKVTVLYEGRQIYFGYASEAKKFFVDLGFQCPERQTTADFLTSLTNPAERKARPGMEYKVPRTPDEFVRAWKESDDHRQLCQEIDEFNWKYPIGGENLKRFRQSMSHIQPKGTKSGSPYLLSIPMQIQLCLSRGWQRLKGDLSIMLSTVIGNFIMGLIVSSLFYNLSEDTDSFYSRSALIFYAILTNPHPIRTTPHRRKHARMALYHPFTEAISSMICDLPSKILTSLSFTLILYFMTNLRRTPAAYFTFLLFTFTCSLAMSMIFRTIGATSRTISQAMAPSAIVMLGLVIYTGFVIPTRDMKVWFRWLGRINPIGYAFEGLMVNEFDGREWPCSQGGFVPQGPGYENATGSERVCFVTGARKGRDVVDGADYLRESFEYERENMWRNLGLIFVFIFAFMFIYLGATEFISAAKSKGEVLLFRRGHAPSESTRKEGDEEDPVMLITSEEKKKAMLDSDVVLPGVGAIQKQTSIFHWEDVCYDIQIQKEVRRLLDHVDGWVEPGKLTALMGASGAGKTTLLDVLASRVTTGVITGSMFVDGKPRDQSFQRKTGYAQQQDLHLETSTVREALLFSARLRQPGHVPDREKVDYVNEVIGLLGMESYADAVVGVPGEGLNVEQRKRLTIGVELAAKPALLLFLDEPTSGLDSQTAWSISLLFQEFDRLLFLAKGGRTIYFGDIGRGSRTLIKYFERQGADRCPPEANPAEWMLHVIGAAPGAVAKRDYADAWRESKEYQKMKKELQKLKRVSMHQIKLQDGPDATPKSVEFSEFAAPFYRQFVMCWMRVMQQYWRTPSYIYSKLALCALTSLFIGFSFWHADNTRQGLQNQMFSIFMLMTMFGNLVNQIMPHFVTQRALYEARERPSKAYSWKAFMLANITAELPWNALAGSLMFFCWFYPIGLWKNAEPTNAVGERSVLLFLFLLSFMLFTSTFTHMIIAGMDSAEAGGGIANLLFSLTLAFCGVLVSPERMPRFWIFLYRVSPFTYIIDGMLSTALANADAFCSPIEISRFDPPPNQTCETYLAAFTSFTRGVLYNPDATSDCEYCVLVKTNTFLEAVSSNYEFRWRNFGILWVYIIFNFGAALGLYWLARVPKRLKQ
ncbi:Multidrug resistance protein [Marasmius tenuissimus]|uniref:Multidrug resistance protein n=1 Tax=Marasmius tenuissimus TaxID=585030 RepID=A0ABR2ZEW4_9AGAR